MKELQGVLEVQAKLIDRDVGEALILYDPDLVHPHNFKRTVHAAGGGEHKFQVIAEI